MSSPDAPRSTSAPRDRAGREWGRRQLERERAALDLVEVGDPDQSVHELVYAQVWAAMVVHATVTAGRGSVPAAVDLAALAQGAADTAARFYRPAP